MKSTKIFIKLLSIIGLVFLSHSQNINLVTTEAVIPIATNGIRNQSFYQYHRQLDCGMPQLYIQPDRSHANYSIVTEGVTITTVTSEWNPIYSLIQCDSNSNCIVSMTNLCNIQSQKHEINWIKLETSIGNIEYLVDCSPDDFYKPFEMGLLLLIILSTVILTLSSLYSKSWSYGGYSIKITKTAVVVFNIVILIAMILGYIMPSIVSFAAQVIGSIIGGAGVSVCVSQLIWLLNKKTLHKNFFKKIRIIDVISGTIGLAFIPLYWLLNGQWAINDIMAICSIVALMKLLKIQSLSLAVFLLGSLLILETIVGIFVHYVIKISYNNYIINIFQNPIILVMPSISNELFRKCAWLPISTILFPGLVVSYLRRFDKSRGTFVYLIIGLVSFYIGSILWMLIDQQTIHSLPFAIISEPVTLIIVIVQSYRRNEFRIIWKGTFHDQELTDPSESFVSKETQIVTPTAYTDLTNSLHIPEAQQSSDNYYVLN